jgi:hypothetical protein
MKTVNKYRFRNWVVIILVVINISALSTFLIAKFSGEARASFEDQSIEVEHVLVEQIGFDQDQLAKYVKLKEKFDQDVLDIRTNMHELMDGMLTEVGKKNPDTNSINRYSQQYGRHQAELKARTMEHFIELRQLTRPGQEERFEEFFGQLQHRHRRRLGRGQGHGFGRGRGMGYGQQRGIQQQNQQVQKDTTVSEY